MKSVKTIIIIILIITILSIIISFFTFKTNNEENNTLTSKELKECKGKLITCDDLINAKSSDNIGKDASHLITAIKFNNVEDCNLIEDNITKEFCLSIVKDDVNKCNALNDKNASELCKKILSPNEDYTVKPEELQLYTIIMAVKTNDINRCNEINNLNLSDGFYSEMGVSLCKMWINDSKENCEEYQYDLCYEDKLEKLNII